MTALVNWLELRDKVQVDDSDIIGVITAILLRHDGTTQYYQYEVEWLHNGINYSQYITGSRLTRVTKHKPE